MNVNSGSIVKCYTSEIGTVSPCGHTESDTTEAN